MLILCIIIYIAVCKYKSFNQTIYIAYIPSKGVDFIYMNYPVENNTDFCSILDINGRLFFFVCT